MPETIPGRKPFKGITEFLHYAGIRYWTASLFPALVGTTLPFWLSPPNFTFRWFGAVEFLIATVLIHSGFSFLHAYFAKKSTGTWPKSRLITCAIICIVLACVLGLHINSCLRLNKYVYDHIFIVFGLSVLFVGVLYVVPPLNFCRRVGGEIILSESLGLLPVLGAYVVQAGDITRTVYIASIPLVVATGLWVWIDKLSSRIEDEKAGRDTIVMLFSPRFSGRYVVLVLTILLFVTIFLAILSASISPLALIALLSAGTAWRIVAISWNGHENPVRMLEARNKSFGLHCVICSIIAISPLAAGSAAGLYLATPLEALGCTAWGYERHDLQQRFGWVGAFRCAGGSCSSYTSHWAITVSCTRMLSWASDTRWVRDSARPFQFACMPFFILHGSPASSHTVIFYCRQCHYCSDPASLMAPA